MIKHYIVLATLIIFMNACTVIGVGTASAVGGTHYLSGEIKSSYPTSIYNLYEGSLYALKRHNINVISVKNTRTDADIQAEFHDGESIKIHIYYNQEGLATLGIRVGLIGDEQQSRQLARLIERYI